MEQAKELADIGAELTQMDDVKPFGYGMYVMQLMLQGAEPAMAKEICDVFVTCAAAVQAAADAGNDLFTTPS